MSANLNRPDWRLRLAVILTLVAVILSFALLIKETAYLFTAFMFLGSLIEYGPTAEIFTNPKLSETSDYVTGRFG